MQYPTMFEVNYSILFHFIPFSFYFLFRRGESSFTKKTRIIKFA